MATNDATHKVMDVHGCGHVAFNMALTEEPLGGAFVPASTVRLLDGSTPARHSPIRCGSCGRPYGAYDLRVEHIVKL